MARLEVDIDANIQGFQKAVDEAVKTATKLGNPFEKTTGVINTLNQRISILKKNLESATDIKSIAQYNRRLQDTQNELQRIRGLGTQSLTAFGNSAQRTAVQVNQLSRATSSYNGIGIEFSRIIQDAPFGIIGIGNNIQQLAGSFQQLRSQSTSTGAALRTALASIISPTNLLVLGISALTSALTFLSINGFFKSKESSEDAAKALDDYRKSLDDVSRSVLQGNIDAQNEIQNLKLLRAQLESESTSRAKKLEAVKALKSQYPDFLGNISNEKILIGDVGDAYDRLTTSLLETSKARAASNIIIRNLEEVLTLQRQQVDNEQAIIDARDKVARLEASAQNSAVNALKINGQFTAQNTELVRAKEDLNKLLEPQIERANRVNALTTENLNLNNQINESIKSGATFTKTVIEETEKLKRVYEDISKLPITNPLERLDQMSRLFEAPISAESGAAETQGIIIPDIVKPFQTQADSIKSIIGDLSASFGGLGSLIGEVFGKKPALGQFIGSFLAFASKLIAANFSIATSNAIVAGSSSAAATGPAAVFTLPAFIAGAIGVVAAAFSAIKGGKSGGGSGGSSSSVSGISSQSYTGSGIEPYGYNDINLTSTIRGSDIVLSVERTQNKENNG